MKPCLECLVDNADDATTCAACGGGSFQHVVDAETQPGGVDTQSPPPTPDNVAADIEQAVQAVEVPRVTGVVFGGVPTDAAVVLREDFKPDAEAAAKMHEVLEQAVQGVETPHVDVEKGEAVVEMSTHPSDPPGNGHDGDIADASTTNAPATKREKKRGSK